VVTRAIILLSFDGGRSSSSRKGPHFTLFRAAAEGNPANTDANQQLAHMETERKHGSRALEYLAV
jgi:hypothetical protein